MAIVFLVVIPWPYVFQNYVKAVADPWRLRAAPRARPPARASA